MSSDPAKSDLPPPPPERKFFICAICDLNEEYTYYGKHPPFCKFVSFNEDSYLVKDPFSPNTSRDARNFLLLGSNCAACNKMVCQECSVYFTKRLCLACYQQASVHLPEELMKSVKASKES